jgi:hypothetical protein
MLSVQRAVGGSAENKRTGGYRETQSRDCVDAQRAIDGEKAGDGRGIMATPCSGIALRKIANIGWF